MRADQRLLQGDPTVGGNGGVGQGAEAGGDPVGRLAFGQRFDDAACRSHAGAGLGTEFDALAVPGDRDDIGDGDAWPAKFHGHITSAWTVESADEVAMAASMTASAAVCRRAPVSLSAGPSTDSAATGPAVP